MSIDTTCPLERLRKFLILSCCRSFIPAEYMDDETVFPERLTERGMVYTEAEDKVSLKRVEEVQFTRAENVAGVIYNSKSGLTRLRWERTSGQAGRLTGDATINAVLKLIESGIISKPSLERKRETLQP